MSGFLKICDFFLRKTAEFSVSDTGDPLVCDEILHVIMIIRQKKVVVFQVPCQKKTGSVGRLYFFFC